MSKIIKHFCFFLSLTVTTLQAQKNIFLDRSFWKAKPDVAAVNQEIAKGNNPSELNGSSFDATVYAIIEDVPNETVKHLLSQKGNDVNKLTHDGRTYIFWAAYKGNVELMNHLLDKGAKTDIIDDHGNTILNFAASTGQANTKVYDLCIRKGANLKKDLNHDGANALLLVAPFDTDLNLINYFVSKGLDIKSTDANGNTAFNYAAKKGNIELMKALVKKGVTFNDNAMIMASQGTRGTSNPLEVYTYLESLNINPAVTGKNGENVLHQLAGKENQREIISHFISKGVDINQADNEGNTVFMNAAARNSETEVINLLIPHLKNVNQLNKKGVSSLAMAVQYNSPEVVGLLLAAGSDVSVINSNGDNLAYYLLQSYNSQKPESFDRKLKLLQDKGLDITKVQKNGNTLYHIAVAKNDLSLLKRINTFNTEVNARNRDGYTALHKAAMTAHDDSILNYLLSVGAKKEELTDFKETAYDLARENEFLTKKNISIEFLK